MITFGLSEQQKNVQQRFHKIAESQIRPLYLEIDQRDPGPIDSRYLKILAKEDLNALVIPKEFGGRPVDSLTLAITTVRLF